MKRVFAALVLLLPMVSFGWELDFSLKAADDYVFEQKEFERTSIKLKVVVLPDSFTFRRIAKEKGIDPDNLRNSSPTKVEAFAILAPGNKCTLYVKDPEWKYEPEYIGHEIAHCIWGRWHKD